MKNNFYIGVIVLFAVGFVGCGKENFLYVPNNPQSVQARYPIREISSSGQVDIVWVIDNSGSMLNFQNTVIANTAAFMSEFYKRHLNWKMGLISTDMSDVPYAGFANGKLPRLDSGVLDAPTVFGNAVQSLGTNGDSTERTFIPIIKALTNDTTFERPHTPIVFIVVTDAPEQSNDGYGSTQRMDASQFLNALMPLVGGRPEYFYGVFASADMGCSSDEGVWNYKGSPYETFANTTVAQHVFPLCKDFGSSLAQIGREIATQVSHPSVYLKTRPVVNTIHVFYHDQELPSGPVSRGGIWTYDYDANAIVFSNLDFSQDQTDGIDVKYTEDNGYDPVVH